jgi:hypothetical protein
MEMEMKTRSLARDRGWDRGREEGANLLSEHPDIT